MLIALIAECAREKAGLGSEFHWASWEDFSSDGLAAQKFEFRIAPLVTRGKRKGSPNWRKSKDKREVWVSDAELKAWVPKWAARTGKCTECMGKGQQMERWHHIEGFTWKPCPLCKGTGLAVSEFPSQPCTNAVPPGVSDARDNEGD